MRQPAPHPTSTTDADSPDSLRRRVGNRLGRRRGRTATASETLPQVPSLVRDLDDRKFTATLDSHVTIVDFWAPWCGPCKVLHPILEGLAQRTPACGLEFAKVNVDVSPQAASALGVVSIPTLVMFDADGTEVDRIIGLPDRSRLEAFVRSATARARGDDR